MERRRMLALAASAALVVVVVAAIATSAGTGSGGSEGATIVVPDPEAVYDPVRVGAALPDGYRVALPRESIEPVYAPEFTDASGVDWPADMLVVGVAGESSAKAYPVTHLNSREMVLDSLEGTPILVSW